LGALAAYALLLRVPLVRNHPEGYVVAFAVATGLAGLAVLRARRRRWPARLALALSGLLVGGGAGFDFRARPGAVVAPGVPVAASVLRVGERPPDFRLDDASGRTVTLSDYRGQKPVVLVFYR